MSSSQFFLVFLLFSVLVIPTSMVLGQMSEPIVVDPTGQKKIRYVIVNGGGDKAADEKFIDDQAKALKGTMEAWADKAKKGSDVTPLEDKTEMEIKEEIKKVGNSLKEGEELVVFYIGHGNVNTGAWFLYDSKFMPAGQITAEELKETLSGFEKITISLISYSCFAEKLEKVVEEAKDKTDKPYGNNIRSVGSDRLVSTSDFPKVFGPFGDFVPGKPDGDKDGGFFTTDEYVEALKQILKDFFKIKQFEEVDGACPLFDGQLVGGKDLPIESTSLLLASAQSFSWMIPLVLSVLGIGLFVVSRKSENSLL